MGIYNLMTEFGGVDIKEVSEDPQWIIAVWPYRRLVTWDRHKLASLKEINISKNSDPTVSAETRDVVIMYGDCQSMTVSAGKEDHLHHLSAQFRESGAQYMSKVFPGSWCMAWIVYGQDRALDLIGRIRRGEACNGFEDGFKFLGKVVSFREKMQTNPGSGTKPVTYSLQCLGFKEFGNVLFHDDQVTMQTPFWTELVGRLNVAVEKIMSYDRNVGMDSNKLLPVVIDLILGQGISREAATPGETLTMFYGPVNPGGNPADTTVPPRTAYVVPRSVGQMLGRLESGSKSGALTFADVLDVMIGVHKYDSDQRDDPSMFSPRGADTVNPRKVLGDRDPALKLLGSFLPVPTPFTNRSVWDIMTGYLNGTVNEMYTAMRVNHEGRVVPTLVVRQKPFSSDIMADQIPQQPVSLPVDLAPVDRSLPLLTRFLELPRWKSEPVLVIDSDLGRGDHTHFNFFHLYGTTIPSGTLTTLASQIARNPPIVDDDDVRREGLRPMMGLVNCSPSDAAGSAPRLWMQVSADFYLGHHLFFNGSVVLFGITAPICHGDNFEYKNVVYHIESVAHHCMETDEGRKQFHTFLTLSHGINSEASRESEAATAELTQNFETDIDDTGTTTELRQYPGLTSEAEDGDPGISAEMIPMPEDK